MKNAMITLVAVFAFAYAAHRVAASPAATENWVVGYVATNAVVSASASNIVVNVTGASAASIAILQDGGSNRVQRASDAAAQAIAPTVNFLFDTCVRF